MASFAGHRGAIAEQKRAISHPSLGVLSNRHSDLLASDIESTQRQEFFFALLNLSLIGALLALQAISRFVRGRLSAAVVIVLVFGFVVQAAQLTWLTWSPGSPSPTKRRTFTFWFIGFNSFLSLALTSITIRGDTAYYALMLLPLLEAAFRLGFGATIAVIVLADFISFLGAYGMHFGEYIEAGAMSVIYTVMGVLVWLLVNNLREQQARSVNNLQELELARQKLLSEEKLAAVGRLSRALAHEIRNPVAMISSSLATARRVRQDEAVREEMFEIAAKEAARLERLTTDFMAYARPSEARVSRTLVADTLNYVATVARPHASRGGITIQVIAEPNLWGNFDTLQMQQALLNLVLNAIEACGPGDLVTLKAETDNSVIRIDVIDPVGPIQADTVDRLFEPLFTTKPGGNGLGLAIARNIARAHGGDILLDANEPGQVCFSIRVPRG
ncbi:MAG: HAMP domain-containing histidine kinase [Deltaproteobacteria bacterium]|nr:HAMP domain-containing histidine kinase [Deltaproteobacteria bacterium]